MLTIFSIPKPFAGHAALIQRNALASWRRLAATEIILFGDEAGISSTAAAMRARYVPTIARNDFGTPLVSDAFGQARALAETPWLMFSNADMLYDESLLEAIAPLAALPRALLSGRRLDIDLTADVSASSHEQWAEIFRKARRRGSLHGPAGMDYFLFRRDLDLMMPKFAVGRRGWDSWLVWHCRMAGIPVIDATQSVTAVHQNHDYKHLKSGGGPGHGAERDLNIRAGGGLDHLLTLREADLHLREGRLGPPPWPEAITARLATTRIYQKTLAWKRRLTR